VKRARYERAFGYIQFSDDIRVHALTFNCLREIRKTPKCGRARLFSFFQTARSVSQPRDESDERRIEVNVETENRSQSEPFSSLSRPVVVVFAVKSLATSHRTAPLHASLSNFVHSEQKSWSREID